MTMKQGMLTRLLITALVLMTANTLAADEKQVTTQKTGNVTQVTTQGHNFNNIGGDVNYTVTGISPKQYRDDLNTLERELTEKYEKTIAERNAAHQSDKRRELEQARLIQEKELTVLRERMATLDESYKRRVETLQQQINDLNEYSYLVSPDALREAQEALAQGDDSKAKEIYTKITQLAKVVDKQAAKASYNLGKMAEEAIDYYGAYQHFKDAVKRDESNPDYLMAAGRLAIKIALYDESIGYYKAVLATLIKELGATTDDVGILWNKLGLAWYYKGQYDKAIRYYERALASDLRVYGSDHPFVAMHWDSLGEAWYKKGHYDKAIEYYEKALASDLLTYGPAHPSVSTSWNNLGNAWQSKGQYDKAIEYYEKALASGLKTYGSAHPWVADCWSNLGAAWLNKGQYDKAIEYLEKALASGLKTYSEDHPAIALKRINLGSAWLAKGQYDKAIEYLEKALASNLKTYGPAHPEVATCWNNLGSAWQSKGQYDKAIEYYEKALSNLESSLGSRHPWALKTNKNLEAARVDAGLASD